VALHLARLAGGEGDEPRRVLREEFEVHPRLVVKAFGVGAVREDEEVLPPRFIRGEDDEVVRGAARRGVAGMAGVRGHVELLPEEGLHPGLARHPVELDRAR